MSRLVQLPPEKTQLATKEGSIRQEWYKYLRDLHSWSGLSGSKFPIWELDVAGRGGWENVDAVSFTVSGNLKTWAFPASAPKSMLRTSLLPRGYTPGTDLYPMALVMPDTGAGGTAVLQFEYGIVQRGDVFPVSTVLEAQLTLPTTPREAMLVVFDAIAGSGLRSGDAVLQALARDTADAADTSSEDVVLLWAGFAYQRSGHGAQEKEP